MSVAAVNNLLDVYREWLREETEIKEVNGWAEITTPFVDRYNDAIQIYAKRENDRWILTDDAYTIRDLMQSGVDIATKNREQLLTVILNRLGVKRDGDELRVIASDSTFARKKHSLIQAIISVGDLFHTSAATVSTLFYEEVLSWLCEIEVRFSESVKLTGKSGFDYNFEAIIPASKELPERILKVVGKPDRASVERTCFAWVDVRENRPKGSIAVAIVNDSEKKLSSSAIDAFSEYEIKTIPWKKRTEHIELLAA